MYAGTIFEQAQAPDAALTLPQACWAVYARIDGRTPVQSIADALALSEAETFAAIQQLQAHNLITEAVLTYEAFQVQSEIGDASHEPEAAASDTASSTASNTASGDGAAGALHLPRLWTWLEETAANQKNYKNTQAFVLMEAADALAHIGVSDMSDLNEVQVCTDAEAIAALEEAIEHNVGTAIPDRCYT